MLREDSTAGSMDTWTYVIVFSYLNLGSPIANQWNDEKQLIWNYTHMKSRETINTFSP